MDIMLHLILICWYTHCSSISYVHMLWNIVICVSSTSYD